MSTWLDGTSEPYLHLIAGDPGAGKTAFGMADAIRMARRLRCKVLVSVPLEKLLPKRLPGSLAAMAGLRITNENRGHGSISGPVSEELKYTVWKRPDKVHDMVAWKLSRELIAYVGDDQDSVLVELSKMRGLDRDMDFFDKSMQHFFPKDLVIFIDEAMGLDAFSGQSHTRKSSDFWRQAMLLRHCRFHFVICTQNLSKVTHHGLAAANRLTIFQTLNRHFAQMIRDAYAIDIVAMGARNLERFGALEFYRESCNAFVSLVNADKPHRVGRFDQLALVQDRDSDDAVIESE